MLYKKIRLGLYQCMLHKEIYCSGNILMNAQLESISQWLLLMNAKQENISQWKYINDCETRKYIAVEIY